MKKKIKKIGEGGLWHPPAPCMLRHCLGDYYLAYVLYYLTMSHVLGDYYLSISHVYLR